MRGKTDHSFSKSKSLDTKAVAAAQAIKLLKIDKPQKHSTNSVSGQHILRKSISMDAKELSAKLKSKNSSSKPLRIRRPLAALSVAELEKKLVPYTMLDKRDPQELTAELFDRNALHFQRPPEFGRKTRRNEKVDQLLPFKSSRLQTMVRCVREEDCMTIDAKLKNVFHKGVLNEDNDTDDSVQQKGVARNFNNLRKAVDRYKLRRRGSQRMKDQREPSASQLELKSRRHHLPGMGVSPRTQGDLELNRPTKNIKRHSLITDGRKKSVASTGRTHSNSMEEEKNDPANMAQEIDRPKSKLRK